MCGRSDGGDVENGGEFFFGELYVGREHARGEPRVVGTNGMIVEELIHHVGMKWDGELQEKV